MTALDIQIHDLTLVHPGDQIEAWDQHHQRYQGTVSQTAPHLGVLWMQEDATGISKLFSVQDYRLRYVPMARAA